MSSIFFLLAALFSPSQPTQHSTPHDNVFPAPVGLILVASTPTGIAIATDGASSNADGTLSQTEKLFAIGKTGLVAIAGTVSIQDPVTRPVREEVNIARITTRWLQEHSDATIDTANKGINQAVAEDTTRYFSTRSPGTAAKGYKFALIVAGLVNGKPAIHTTMYYMPSGRGKPMRAETITAESKEGALSVFGQTRIEQALIGNPPLALAGFSKEAPMKKLRSASPQVLSLQDYVNAFDVILRATESAQAKTVNRKIAVTAPNKMVTISKEGITWHKTK